MTKRNGGNEWILLQTTKKCELLILEIQFTISDNEKIDMNIFHWLLELYISIKKVLCLLSKIFHLEEEWIL